MIDLKILPKSLFLFVSILLLVGTLIFSFILFSGDWIYFLKCFLIGVGFTLLAMGYVYLLYGIVLTKSHIKFKFERTLRIDLKKVIEIEYGKNEALGKSFHFINVYFEDNEEVKVFQTNSRSYFVKDLSKLFNKLTKEYQIPSKA